MSDTRRIVVKIGTSVLLDENKKVSSDMILSIARQVRQVKELGFQAILVSSGAIACGMETVGLKKRPVELEKRQALASVGQVCLMKMYMDTFAEEGLHVGQILLTHEDIKSKTRCINLMNTINTLLEMDIVPVINENDTLSVKEIRFGDNDNLSALIAQISDAHLLFLLSDVEGLFDKDPSTHPNATMIKVVARIDEEIEETASGTRSEKSTGGMVSKLEAAKKASSYGIATKVVLGTMENVIVRLAQGEDLGTLFLPGKKITRGKWWTAYAYKVRGVLWIDGGAEEAILRSGSSLLPSGVVKSSGEFRRGECIELFGTSADRVIARGIANYCSADVDKIKGSKSSEIEKKLGYKYTDEIIHRDNMVVL